MVPVVKAPDGNGRFCGFRNLNLIANDSQAQGRFRDLLGHLLAIVSAGTTLQDQPVLMDAKALQNSRNWFINQKQFRIFCAKVAEQNFCTFDFIRRSVDHHQKLTRLDAGFCIFI